MANYIWDPPSADSKLGKSPKGAVVSLSDAEAAGIRAAWPKHPSILIPADAKVPAEPPAPIVRPKPVKPARGPK